MAFPLPHVPQYSYRHMRSRDGTEANGRAFGARRPNERLHAACDLIAPAGTAVRAIEDGHVLKGPTYFYSDTYYLVVRHSSGRVVRYGEIDRHVPADIKPGAPVKEGQVIAHVGRLRSGSSMLHFELYAGTEKGIELTVRANAGYQRRRDLLDPTVLLDQLAASDPALRRGKT